MRLALLVALAALFALIPAAQASAAEYTLKVAVVGEGVVFCEVDSSFEGECEKEEKYEEGTEITLLAEPEVGWEFVEWKGDCTGGSDECELEMDEPHEATAVFALEPVTEYKLEINVVGPGAVECELESGPEECKAKYPEETELALIPVEDAGSEFVGFSGDCSGGECELEMNSDHSVTATFKAESGGEEEEGSTSQTKAPPALGPGKARVGGAGLYRGGKATLRLTCKGGGACKGTVKLIAKLKVGKKGKKNVTVGKRSFSLPANGSRTIKVKLSRPAKKLLRRGRTLIAKVRGRGVVASKVKIRPSAR